MSYRKRIAFAKVGSFSHTNESVLNLLTRHFDDYDIDVIDVWKDLVDRREPLNVLSCMGEYVSEILSGRKRWQDCLSRTPYIFKKIKRAAAGRVVGQPYAFTFQTQSLFDASVPGVPHFVYTDHTHLANLHYPAFRKAQLYSSSWIALEKTIYQNAALNFTMSANISRSIVEQYSCDPAKVVTVYCGNNVDVSSDEASPRTYSRMNILFVGVEWERKGGPQLLEAFRIVRHTYPQATLTIVGCSPSVNVPNCEVVGRVPLGRVSAYYKTASICCVPTRIEPFGIVFLEALAHKLPVIATTIGALPEIVSEGESGYLVHPDDTRQLATRLIELLGDPNKCKMFGDNGYRSMKETYAWEKVGVRMKAQITSLLNSSDRAA